MTTDRQMTVMYIAQQEVIAVLYVIGEVDLADRFERCMTARRERRGGDGWPFSCRSVACVWCRRPLIRSWWIGLCQWSAAATTWVTTLTGCMARVISEVIAMMAGSTTRIGWERLRATVGHPVQADHPEPFSWSVWKSPPALI
jgi:hypothetical protein